MVATGRHAFDRALAAYTQHLSAKERASIKTPTSLSDLVSQAQAMADALVRDRMKRSAFQTFGKKARLLEPFEKLVEGMCKSTPIAGDLIWGSVSFILQMMKNNIDACEEVLGFFQTMAEEVGHIGLQEDTFAHSALVQSVVEALYTVILEFWVEAVTYYRSKSGGLRRRLKTFVLSTSIDKKFQALTEAISKQKARLHEVSSGQHNADSSSFYKEIKGRERTARQRHLKQWLNAPDYERDFRTANEYRYPGTCEWVQKESPFIEWMSSTSSASAFIHGIPGAGKTILSSWVIKEAQGFTNADTLVLYHYFKDSDTDKRSALSAVRSFLDQLLNHLMFTENPTLLSQLEMMLDKASLQRPRHADFADLWDILSVSLTSFAQAKEGAAITIVGDALDECVSPQTLIMNLLDLAQQSHGKIKIFLTGRKSAWDLIDMSLSTTSLLQPLVLEITPEGIQQDVRAFVRYTISGIPRLRNHEDLRGRLIEEIGRVENHQGMFLWVYLMCEEIKRQGNIRVLQKLLDRLPKGLDTVYGRICTTVIERDEGVGLSLSVLKWIVNSPRPLRFSELQEGLRLMQALDSNSSSRNDWFDGASDLLWSRQDILDACGNLATHTGIDRGDSFGLVHLSATQFFRADTTHLPSGSERIKAFINDVLDAGQTLAIICLDYLISDALRPVQEGHASKATHHSQPREDSFKTQHLLFDFAIVHWSDLVLHWISRGTVDASLLEKITNFISDPSVEIWLEHSIRHSSIEVTMHTIRRFTDVSADHAELAEFMAWAHRLLKLLGTYAQTLSRKPDLVSGICWDVTDNKEHRPRTWQLVHSYAETTPVAHEIPPLEAIRRSWIHYISGTDVLLSFEACSDAIRLRRQILTTGVPMRPLLVESYNRDIVHPFTYFHSAAISPSGQLIAAVFYKEQDLFSFRVACWRLPLSDKLIKAETHSDLVLFDSVDSRQHVDPWNPSEAPYVINIVAFRGEDTLITPRGLYAFKDGEWQTGPAAIFAPDMELQAEQTYFSGNGERAIRVNTRFVDEERFVEIEVLNTRDGATIYTVESPDMTEPHLVALSHSGQKLILAKNSTNDRVTESSEGWGLSYICLFVDLKSTIKLDTPHEIIGPLQYPQFTTDEETVVACHSLIEASAPHVIAVWRLAKDSEGHYIRHASASYIFKSHDFSIFCLLEQVPLRQQNAIIVSSLGVVTRRSLDEPWSANEEGALGREPLYYEDAAFSADERCFIVVHYDNHGCCIMLSLTVFDIHEDSISQRASIIVTTFTNELNLMTLLRIWAQCHPVINYGGRTELALAHPIDFDVQGGYRTVFVIKLAGNDNNELVSSVVIPPYNSNCCLELNLKLIGTEGRSQSRHPCIIPDRFIGPGQFLDFTYLVWPEDRESEVTVIVAMEPSPLVIQTGIKSGDMMEEAAWKQVLEPVRVDSGDSSADEDDPAGGAQVSGEGRNENVT
ncbi:hypothetical protein DXG01_006468 [Tephrocybe rancida]|nr:hypothetical protein DXG01_006468 [Tephrocybe rancida]